MDQTIDDSILMPPPPPRLPKRQKTTAHPPSKEIGAAAVNDETTVSGELSHEHPNSMCSINIPKKQNHSENNNNNNNEYSVGGARAISPKEFPNHLQKNMIKSTHHDDNCFGAVNNNYDNGKGEDAIRQSSTPKSNSNNTNDAKKKQGIQSNFSVSFRDIIGHGQGKKI